MVPVPDQQGQPHWEGLTFHFARKFDTRQKKVKKQSKTNIQTFHFAKRRG